ncbi:MAG: Txe/YoeB family addiction module toxin [Oscillospiraceae bacterium]|jgi:Txe/YoeB family toxin of toxin-antitoxin system|nr:Txe/YoeB family addiction module toxin [Oscillospiraceae bacterium]
MTYKLKYSRQAEKDARLLERAGLDRIAVKLLAVIQKNPYQTPPRYEKLTGQNDTYSRRINIQHRLVYEVLPNDDNLSDVNGMPYKGIIKVIRMWTHYE